MPSLRQTHRLGLCARRSAAKAARPKIRAFALALLVAAGVSSADAGSFRVYSNPRFGATAEVPRDWRPSPPPENGDGLDFQSPDNQASIFVGGVLNIDDTVEAAMNREEEPYTGQTVTFRQRGRRSITISGLQGDLIFYRKSILVCHDQIWNRVYLEYPAARKAEYDALVVRVARSLHFSGASAQIPDCR